MGLAMSPKQRQMAKEGGCNTTEKFWIITPGSAKEKKVLLVKKSNITESAGAQGYEALVAAQSRTLGHLSRDIATAVKSVSREMSDQ